MARQHRYPRFEYEFIPAEDGTECHACSRLATRQALIRWGPMRGTDMGYAPVCERHAKMLESEPSRAFAHLRTKDKFLGREEFAEDELPRGEG